MSLTLDGRYVLQAPRYYRHMVKMSDRLYRTVWRQYRDALAGSIDDPQSDEDVIGWLEEFAAERVNNPGSSFYLRGE